MTVTIQKPAVIDSNQPATIFCNIQKKARDTFTGAALPHINDFLALYRTVANKLQNNTSFGCWQKLVLGSNINVFWEGCEDRGRMLARICSRFKASAHLILGNMAVSNALGSNIFDIQLGLGVPWFLSTLLTRQKPLPISTVCLHCMGHDLWLRFRQRDSAR